MTKNIYKGRIVNLNLETVTLPNGAMVELEVIHHPGAAAVVPLKDARTVILIRQYRHAVGGYIYEIPAGKLHPGEDPRECALRELEEEIGYKAGELQHVTSAYTTPGFTDEVRGAGDCGVPSGANHRDDPGRGHQGRENDRGLAVRLLTAPGREHRGGGVT